MAKAQSNVVLQARTHRGLGAPTAPPFFSPAWEARTGPSTYSGHPPGRSERSWWWPAWSWRTRGGKPHKTMRRFGTMTDDLLALGDWPGEEGVTHVAMEATGVY